MKRPKRPAAHFLALGFAAHEAGRLDEAAQHYRKALAANPREPDALHLLGTIALQRGAYEEAATLIERAVRVNPNHPAYHTNLGMAYKDLGDLDRADAALRKAIALQPDFAEAHNNLGVALAAKGRFSEASASFRRAVGLRADYPEALLNLGMALAARGRRNQAATALRRSLALQPDSATALAALGTVLSDLKQIPEARQCVERAIELAPDSPQALAFRGIVLAREGETERALADLARAVELKPGYAEARFALCTSQIPVLYQDEQELETRRAHYETELRALNVWCTEPDPRRLWPLVHAVGSAQPFHLAYQGKNDRDLQRLYGSMICHIMQRAYPAYASPSPSPTRERIRVGIVSGFFRRHSNWKIPIKGWVQQLDRARFSVFAYHTADACDEETKEAERSVDKFVQGPLDLEQWCTTILEDRPDVLLYPEIGMDPIAPKLAALRLAPVQCGSWGHPMTTGFPTIDYFLSSDLMEPEDADDHYTERLVRLPNLSICYDPLPTDIPSKTRQDFGLPDENVLYWCCQSLFKYLPQHDTVFPRIAAKVPEARFVFIRYPEPSPVTGQFQARLARAFERYGLKADDYCLFLPQLNQGEFAAAIRVMDVFMDSVGWSGCNSALEAIEGGLPVVTVKGTTMRGNHCKAILEMLGQPELIGATIDEYLDLAVRLGTDEAWRREVAARVCSDRHRLYHDTTCVRALEAFFERVTTPT